MLIHTVYNGVSLSFGLLYPYMFVFFPCLSIFCFRDHPEATQQMNDLIIAKVSAALKGHWANPDLVGLRGHTENNLNPTNIVCFGFFLGGGLFFFQSRCDYELYYKELRF